MIKNVYSFLIFVCLLTVFFTRTIAQGNFESFLRVAEEKRFISDSYKETHLSAIANADWVEQYDFQSLYFYAKGIKKLYGDIYLQFSINPPDAICAGSLIVRFNEEGKLLEHALIEVNCQQDEKSEFFLSSEYGFINDSIIEIQYKKWENVDLTFGNEETGYSYLLLGKEKLVSLESEPLADSDTEVYMLAHKLLQTKDLQAKTKAQLRVLRNSVFAKHGYSFNSKDLAEHFEAQTWYKKSGKSQVEILQEMNGIEKINIQFIRRAEKNLE